MSKKLSLINPTELFIIDNKYLLKPPNFNINKDVIEAPNFLSSTIIEKNLESNIIPYIEETHILKKQKKMPELFLNQKIDCKLLLTLCEKVNF